MGVLAGAELALVICVGCTPAIPRLYRLLSGNKDDEKRAHVQQNASPHKNVQKTPSIAGNKKARSNALNFLAKYMGAGGGQSLFNDKDDEEAQGIVKTVSVSFEDVGNLARSGDV